jgi:EAL domain-containing protein (putative c-di-GMP-specific phosphodiesterase class I)
LREWLDAGLYAPRCAVNLSAHQLASLALIDDIRSALARHRLPPDALEVELTESVLMADPERANGMLQQLHAMGVRISIDDFGTGYSSLSYLKRFPAQALKIDRSFIRGLPADDDDVAITQAVIAMAHSLGLQVVAEGVETAEQLAMLRDLGCDEAQGFHLHRPLPAEELSALLQQVPLLLTQAA